MCWHCERWIDDRANSASRFSPVRRRRLMRSPWEHFVTRVSASKGWAPRRHKPKLGVHTDVWNIANAPVRNYMTTEEPALRAISRLAPNQRTANEFCAHVNSGAAWPAPDCGPWLESHGTQSVPTQVPRFGARRTVQEYRFFDGRTWTQFGRFTRVTATNSRTMTSIARSTTHDSEVDVSCD
jgi:hypothetical protein